MKEESPDYQSSTLDVYYANRDLRLLLDFFSISSGVAPALLILASLDQVIREEMIFFPEPVLIFSRVSGYHSDHLS